METEDLDVCVKTTTHPNVSTPPPPAYQKEVGLVIGKTKVVDQRLVTHRLKSLFEAGKLNGKVCYGSIFKVIAINLEAGTCLIETDYQETVNEIRFIVFTVAETILAGLVVLNEKYELRAEYRSIRKQEEVAPEPEPVAQPYIETRPFLATYELPIFITEQHFPMQSKWDFLKTIDGDVTINGLFEGEKKRRYNFAHMSIADFVVTKIDVANKIATIKAYQIPSLPPEQLLLTFVWIFNTCPLTGQNKSVDRIVGANTIDVTPWNEHKLRYEQQREILKTL